MVYQGGQFAYITPEGGEVVQEGAEAQQVAFYGAPMVAAAPARVNVSPEIFAKLAAGGQLTPEEMAQLSGQPAPGQFEATQGASIQQPMPGQQQPGSPAKQPGSPAKPGAVAGVASGKKD